MCCFQMRVKCCYARRQCHTTSDITQLPEPGSWPRCLFSLVKKPHKTNPKTPPQLTVVNKLLGNRS